MRNWPQKWRCALLAVAFEGAWPKRGRKRSDVGGTDQHLWRLADERLRGKYLGQHFHPEFGYFCPAPRLQREVRVAFFAFLIGAAIGAVSVLALSANDGDADTASAEARVASTPGSATHRLSEAKPDEAPLGPLHVTDTVARNDGGKTIASDPNSSTANAVGSTMVDPQVQGTPSVIGVPSGAAAPSKETTAIDAGAGVSERSELSPPVQVQSTPADIPRPPTAEDAARARRHAAPVPRRERMGARFAQVCARRKGSAQRGIRSSGWSD